jgi:thioredoxin-like negative regulator of GroEL
LTRYSLIAAFVAFAVLANTPRVFGQDTHAKGQLPRNISFGAEVNLEDYLAARKITIFDFYSDYCRPCREMEPYLEALHTRRDGFAVVIINVNRRGVRGIDWNSPVARQFQLGSIPYLIIYNEDGELNSEGEDARAKVAYWLKD